ncbi:MAG: RNA pseudouridine synthase, partial [Candidatus Omnitrophica bacterium CG12_big_fil_rev_8_21_14_0_65_50_5]
MPDIKDHFLKASPEDVDARLDVFVTAHVDNLPSRTFVQKLIEQGYVTVNEEKEKANYKIEAGDDIHIRVPKTLMPPSEAAAEDIALDIFYEDDAIIVVNKASGMLVHPAVGR